MESWKPKKWWAHFAMHCSNPLAIRRQFEGWSPVLTICNYFGNRKYSTFSSTSTLSHSSSLQHFHQHSHDRSLLQCSWRSSTAGTSSGPRPSRTRSPTPSSSPSSPSSLPEDTCSSQVSRRYVSYQKVRWIFSSLWLTVSNREKWTLFISLKIYKLTDNTIP